MDVSTQSERQTDFRGRVALVTGAAVGIGRAVALHLAARGAQLILCDLDEEKLAAVGAELPGEALLLPCDVSDEAQVNETVRKGLARFGKIDILVNNAALWRGSSTFLETSVESWRRFIDVNLMGVVFMTRAVLGQMIERGYGRIVNVASVAGVYGCRHMVRYSATKGALIAMTRALAKELSDKGVLVNAVSPGTVSPSSFENVDYTQPSEISYMGRTGSDAENASLIAFLASDAMGYISGENIIIDGCRRRL